jgi:hypothetical protein
MAPHIDAGETIRLDIILEEILKSTHARINILENRLARFFDLWVSYSVLSRKSAFGLDEPVVRRLLSES